MSSFKYELQVFGDSNWYGNAVRFATAEEAAAAGKHKMFAWTQATAFRVSSSPDPVNYRWDYEQRQLTAVDRRTA